MSYLPMILCMSNAIFDLPFRENVERVVQWLWFSEFLINKKVSSFHYFFLLIPHKVCVFWYHGHLRTVIYLFWDKLSGKRYTVILISKNLLTRDIFSQLACGSIILKRLFWIYVIVFWLNINVETFIQEKCLSLVLGMFLRYRYCLSILS